MVRARLPVKTCCPGCIVCAALLVAAILASAPCRARPGDADERRDGLWRKRCVGLSMARGRRLRRRRGAAQPAAAGFHRGQYKFKHHRLRRHRAQRRGSVPHDQPTACRAPPCRAGATCSRRPGHVGRDRLPQGLRRVRGGQSRGQSGRLRHRRSPRRREHRRRGKEAVPRPSDASSATARTARETPSRNSRTTAAPDLAAQPDQALDLSRRATTQGCLHAHLGRHLRAPRCRPSPIRRARRSSASRSAGTWPTTSRTLAKTDKKQCGRKTPW